MPLLTPHVPPLKGLGFNIAAYPALKHWAIIFRPAARDSFRRFGNLKIPANPLKTVPNREIDARRISCVLSAWGALDDPEAVPPPDRRSCGLLTLAKGIL